MWDQSQMIKIDRLAETINNFQKLLSCSICQELIKEPTKTRCGHSFCKPCIGKVLRKKGASCPICRNSLNRRNISKDDHLQICIEKFKILVDSIEIDSHINILSHVSQPRDTKESCSWDTDQFTRDSNKNKSSKKDVPRIKKSMCQSDSSAKNKSYNSSVSHQAINDRVDQASNQQCNLKIEASPNPFDDKNDNTLHNPIDMKICTWLHSFPDNASTDDPIAEKNEMPIEDEARPMNPISDDDDKSDEADEVYHDSTDARRKPRQDRKRSTDCPKRIGEDGAGSQVSKETSQIGEVIKIDSGLKYIASHARIHMKEYREKIARSNLEKTVSQNNSSSTAVHDQVATSMSLNVPTASTSTEQFSSNWSRVMEVGKEMKRAKKKKEKLHVSTEKKKKPPKVIENIELTPNKKYDTIALDKILSNKRKANISIHSESNNRKQDAIDKSLNLSDTNIKSFNETSKLESHNSSKSNEINSSYITLEEGRKIRIINLNDDEMSKIIGFDSNAENSECSENLRHKEKNSDCSDMPLQERLSGLTQKKLNKSLQKITHDVLRTPVDNFRSSPCSTAEKRTPEPREASNVQGTPNEAASSPNKGRLSLRRKLEVGDNRNINSPLLSQVPLSYRLLIDKKEINNSWSVNSPISITGEKLEKLKLVKRDLNFKRYHEDQHQTDRNTASASTHLTNIIENEDIDENVPGVVQVDLGRNFTDNFTKKTNPTRSKTVQNRSCVKFLQLGTLIRRRNVKYLFLGTTKRERSMSADVQINPVHNMQQLTNKPDMLAEIIPDQWGDSQNSNNITVVENICPANNMNSSSGHSKKSPELLPTYKASVTSTQKIDRNSNLSKKNSTSTVRSSNANQRSDEPIKNVAVAIAHTYPGTSNSIKLLSPDKDSQLKFLTIDSPLSEREKIKCAGHFKKVLPFDSSLIKSTIKGNNNSEMESSRLAESMINCTREPPAESPSKKRKRTERTGDRELFEDGSNDGNDSIHSDSSRSTIKLDIYNELEESHLNAKKRRLSYSGGQDIDVSLSSLKEQDASEKIPEMSRSDTKPKSTHITKLKSDDQCTRRNASTAEMKEHRMRPDNFELNDANWLDEDQRITNTVDKWSSKCDKTQNKLTKKSKNTQNSSKSVGNPSEENSQSHQSSCSGNALKMKTNKNEKPSQESCAKELYKFESSSLFNSENIDYIMQQSYNTDVASKKIVEPTNDDIINRVLDIDRSRGNSNTCRTQNSNPRNDSVNQREKDNEKDLLQDNFDEIIASIEQPQSVEIIPCTESSAHNLNRPVAKQKTSNYLAMTDEPCSILQQTPILSSSSAKDIFEDQFSRNDKKPSTNTILRTPDKKNVACGQKKQVDDRKDRSDAITKADTIDYNSHKKIKEEHNVSQEKEKSFEERNTSIELASLLHNDDDKMQKIISTRNRSNSKDDTLEHSSLMNITQHQVQLQMFEEDLFGVPTQNQTKLTKRISQDNQSVKIQRTPRKKKNTPDKNARPGEHSADEDDVVENTPEKKTKKVRPVAQSTPITHNSIVTLNRSSISRGTKNERIESGSILLARQVDMKTPENVTHQLDKRDLCFTCSGLSAAQIYVVKRFAAIYNANYVSQFNHNVTHVIMKTIGEENSAESTLKYLQGIAHRKWVVSFRWVEDCIKQQKWLNELPYEVTTSSDVGLGINVAGPRNSRLRKKDLFRGFTFLCVGPYDNVSLSQYQDLLVATGATVVEFFDIFAKLEGMKGVVIQDNPSIHDQKKIEHWYRTAKAAPINVEWIVECISHYKLFKITPYMLSPEDYCAIGYPRGIVDEESNLDE